jgi:hypothetical protein
MVDLSNIIGVNIDEFLGTMADADVMFGFGDLAGVVIAAIIVVIVGGTAALLALFLIFACIALRSLVLTALIIISPIAFVLYLLPNTAKWFKKWMNEFTRMLFVFPMIAGVWGLAKFMMSVAADANPGGFLGGLGAWVIKILLMIAPAACIIPIMKFGGQAMGAIAKGVHAAADKTGASKWAKDSDALRRQKQMSGEGITNKGPLKWAGVGKVLQGASNRAQLRGVKGQIYKRRQTENAANKYASSKNPAIATAFSGVQAQAEEEDIKNAEANLQDKSHDDIMESLRSGKLKGAEQVAAIRRVAEHGSASDMGELISKGVLDTEGRHGVRIRTAIAGNKHIQSMGANVASNIGGGNTKAGATRTDKNGEKFVVQSAADAFRHDMDAAAEEMDADKIRNLDHKTLGFMAAGASDDAIDALNTARNEANVSSKGRLSDAMNGVALVHGGAQGNAGGTPSNPNPGASGGGAGTGGPGTGGAGTGGGSPSAGGAGTGGGGTSP